MRSMITPPGQTGEPQPAAKAGKRFDIVDLKQYFYVVVRRIWLVALCFVISLVVMVVMLSRQVPVYRSTSKVLLTKGLPLPHELSPEEIRLWGDYMLTQQNIMQSKLLMNRARKRVNRPAAEFGEKYRGVSIVQQWKTAIINITANSTDPVFAADFANALAEEYLDFKAEERMESSQSQVISLTQQANRLLEEIEKAEARVLAFIKENNVVAIQERGNIAAANLAELAERAADYKTQRMLLEAKQPLLMGATDETVLATLSPMPSGDLRGMRQPLIASLEGMENNDSASGVEPSTGRGPEALIEHGVVSEPMWEALKRQRARLEAELEEMRTRFKEAHPLIQKALDEMREIDRELNVELQFGLRQFYTQLDALAIQEKAARQVELEWEDEALRISKMRQEFGNIQRVASRLQRLYDLIFNRLKEIDISVGIEPEFIRILERAEPAGSPASPRKGQSIFLAALIGLGVGLALIFGLEYIDDSVRLPEDVTQALGLPFFGVIPAANWDPDDLRTHMLSNIDQKSGLAEAYRNVRSSLMFTAGQDRVKSCVITSAVPLEGKTTTCLNLAVSLAQAGSRVLMVDGDLRRGSLHKFFGLEGGRGFSDALAGQAKPEAVIQRTGIPHLDLMATGPFPPNPAELMLRGELNVFLDYAKRHYDKIFFDCPPVMSVSEAATLCSLVEGVIFIVWAGHTSRRMCRLAIQTLVDRGANVLGCVLNNLEFGRVGYYYSAYYGYYDYDYTYGREQRAGR